jgi:hypothetical protein
MGPIGCPETSVRNYRYTLRNIPKQRISLLLRGESLKSRSLSVQYENVTTTSFKITSNYPLSIVLSFTPVYADSSPATNWAIRIYSWQLSCEGPFYVRLLKTWCPLFSHFMKINPSFLLFARGGTIEQTLSVHGLLNFWVCYITSNCSKSKRHHSWQHSWLPTYTHIQNTRPKLGLYTQKIY